LRAKLVAMPDTYSQQPAPGSTEQSASRDAASMMVLSMGVREIQRGFASLFAAVDVTTQSGQHQLSSVTAPTQ
jgi:hypothetical protein